MRVSICLFLASLAACVSEPPPPQDGVDAVSFVEEHVLPAKPRSSLDLLIVIDDTVAMAEYQARLASLPAVIEQLVTSLDSGLRYFDVHIAVTSNDGVLRSIPALADPFAALYLDYDLTTIANYTGSLASVLAQLVDVGATNTGPSQPLAALQLALEHDSSFLRANAYLGVVIVSATDDASGDSVAAYAQWLKSLKTDPANVVLVGVTGNATPRLDELLAAFPDRHTEVALTADDYAPAIGIFGQLVKTTLEGYCWNASDVDPITPGPQYDCTFAAIYGGAEHVLPPCTGGEGADAFCWSLAPASYCPSPEELEPTVRPYDLWLFRPELRAQCVVNR